MKVVEEDPRHARTMYGHVRAFEKNLNYAHTGPYIYRVKVCLELFSIVPLAAIQVSKKVSVFIS